MSQRVITSIPAGRLSVTGALTVEVVKRDGARFYAPITAFRERIVKSALTEILESGADTRCESEPPR
jgi:hypothetical protein